MKRYLFLVTALFIFIGSVFSQKIDNIILLDTSMSMFPYYSGTIGYLIEDIIEKQLEPGDSFHLLSFNDFPEYEISRTIKSESELEDVLNRILLLQPVGQYTDLIAAFSYLYEYVDELPANSIKKLIILTDGIHDPPPGSIYPVSEENKNDIIKISENMKRQGWEVSLIRFPLQNKMQDTYNSNSSDNNTAQNNDSDTAMTNVPASSQGNDLFPDIAETLGESIIPYEEENSGLNYEITGAPEIVYPSPLGTVGNNFKPAFTFINHSQKPVLLKLEAIMINNTNILETATSIKIDPGNDLVKEIAVRLPDDFQTGNYKSRVELIFKDSFRAYPRTGILEFTYDPQAGGFLSDINGRLILYIGLAVFILILLTLVVLKIVSILRTVPVKTLSVSGTDNESQNRHVKISSSKALNKRVGKGLKPGEIAVEMTVMNQNRHIGQRNIHIIKNGTQRSVGGAGSEYFLIFIIQTGKRIAELIMEEDVVKFVPRDKDFFPDFNGDVLEDCLSKPIKVVNRDGVETEIVFNLWISPVEKLNRVMHLLDSKGKPDFTY